jgi:hypothetical protein
VSEKPLTWGDPPRHEWCEEGEDLIEYRWEVLAVVECPECGNDVDLEAETDEWTQGEDGRWYHEGYGPPTGVCCGLLLVDNFDGPEAYYLTRRGP